MASVTPDRVRDRVNLSSADISDSIVTEFIKDAEAEIELETGLTIDYSNCTQAEASTKSLLTHYAVDIKSKVYGGNHGCKVVDFTESD